MLLTDPLSIAMVGQQEGCKKLNTPPCKVFLIDQRHELAD